MAIPTRFGIGQGAAGTRELFNQLLQGSMGAGARPAATTMTTAPQTRMRGDIPMRLPQERQRPRMPLEAAILSGTGAMPSAGFVSAPKAPPSIGDRIAGMLPAAGTPEAAGLGAAGARMLQLSGYSDKPIAMSQILGEAAQAYMDTSREERRANLADRIAMAELGIKAGDGGGLAGKSIFAQTGNTLLRLAPKIKAGTATEEEKALYSYVYGAAAKPQTQTSFDPEGNKTITEIPAQDLPEDLFPRPEGFRDPLTTTQPSAKSLKDAAKLKDTRKMLQNLNAYRQTLQNPDFSVVAQAGGALGFPSGLAATAGAQAQALRMDLKNLYELGALVGGDFQILDSLLTNPNSADAIKGGRDLLLSQLDQLERQLELDMAAKDVSLAGTFSMPIIANTKDDYDKAPNYTYVELPDGRVVYKDPRVRNQ